MLIPSYVVCLASLALIAGSVIKLSHVNRETNRAHNRILHRLKLAGFAACISVVLVKSLVRIWYIATAQGPYFRNESWWKHLNVISVVGLVGTAGLAVYLLWADRPFPPGHCKSCGYNLRGLTENRCPECFTEFDLADVPEA